MFLIRLVCMENKFEGGKFEHEPTFEITINEIKHIHLKIINSTAVNSSAITSFDENFYSICINNSFKAEHFEPEPTLEKTINEIKANHLKSITSIYMNVSAINLKNPTHLLNIKNPISCHEYS